MTVTPVKLNAKTQGSGEPVILIHGLFGSLSNLGMLGKFLAQFYTVHSLDVRNHGESPHVDTMDFPSMSSDVIKYMDDVGIPSAVVIGHSMGGKIAMQMALDHADRIKKLIIIDIAPVAYAPRHDAIFAGLDAIDLNTLSSRQEANEILERFIEEAGVRSFLLKNLFKNTTGKFAWRMDLNAIKNNYDVISEALSGTPFSGSTLFIKGNRSVYLIKEYKEAVLNIFPNAQLKIVDGAGHWLHAEKPDLLHRMIERFLAD